MSALGTITASCVHCLWRTDVEGDALREARDTHELMHPGGTVLVVGVDVDEIMADVEEVLSGQANGKKPRGFWTREKVVEAIQAFHAEHDRLPTSRECQTRSDLPARITMRRTHGSQREAFAATGLVLNGTAMKRTVVPLPAPKPKRQARRNRAPQVAAEPAPEPNLGAVEGTLVDSAQLVSSLSARRRAMLAELDELEREQREAVAQLEAALSEHRL